MTDPTRPARRPAPPVALAAAAALFGTLVLSACGGGSSAASDAGTAPVQTDVPAPARTAPTIPVSLQSAYAASGAGSYQEAVRNYNRVGEVLHAR